MNQKRLALVTLIVATALFGLAVAMRDQFDPWLTNLAAAIISSSLALVVLQKRLRLLFAFHWQGALVAVAMGVAMVVATHLGYWLVTALVPQLKEIVEQLYLDIAPTSPSVFWVAPLILAIVAAEELVWRGVTFTLLGDHRSPVYIALMSALLYALPQLIGGSWLLLCAALSLGMLVGIQRAMSGRLTDVVITHGVWSVAIFGLLPLA